VGTYLIIRKLFPGLIAGVLLMLIYFLLEQSGFVLLIGMYLLPILLIYGVLASILSDFVTKRLRGLLRGSLALFIHLFFAASFVLMPILEMERRFNRLVLITALLSIQQTRQFGLKRYLLKLIVYQWRYKNGRKKIGYFKGISNVFCNTFDVPYYLQ